MRLHLKMSRICPLLHSPLLYRASTIQVCVSTTKILPKWLSTSAGNFAEKERTDNLKTDQTSTKSQRTRTVESKKSKPARLRSLERYLLPDCHIVYNDANILALNKPQFLPVFGKMSSNGVRNSEHPPKSISQILPEMARDLRCPELDVCLSLKSFYSGVILLSKSKKSKESFERYMKMIRGEKVQLLTFLAITCGVPKCNLGSPLLKAVSQEYIHDQLISVINPVERVSKKGRKTGKQNLVPHMVDVLAVNEKVGAALVKMSVYKENYSVIEATLSSYHSPILGDRIYSPRSYSVRGVPFTANAHTATPGTQRLSPELTECLESDPDLATDSQSRLFLHRHQVQLEQFPTNSSKPIIITAEPPSHFLRALRILGLSQGNNFLES